MRFKVISITLSICLVFGGLFYTFPKVHADDAADLKAQIEERNKNIAELEKEIAAYQAEADKTSAKAQSLASTIKSLELTQKKLDTDIKLTENKIKAADLTIQELGGEITDKEARIINLRNATAESIKLIAQEESNSLIETFLKTKSLAESLDSIGRLFSITNEMNRKVKELQGVKFELEENVNESEKAKNDLEQFQEQLSDKKLVVSANKNEQNKLYTETKNTEAGYQAILADKKAKKAAFEKELFEYESKLKYVLNPNTIPSAGSSVFSWPTDDLYITQFFGVTSASGRLYASGSHNGVDFKALMGTPIKAILTGTVIGTGDTDIACPGASFGRWVLIKNDNGLAEIYAHLSVIKVSEGQRVNTGDIIAFSGNTGYSTGPHLHISVYAANAVEVQNRPSLACGGKVYRMPIAPVNAYLDPMLYFPKL